MQMNPKVKKELNVILEKKNYKEEEVCVLTIQDFSYYFVNLKPEIHFIGMSNANNFLQNDTYSKNIQTFYNDLLGVPSGKCGFTTLRKFS